MHALGGKVDLGRLQQGLREFARERDWEQFHHPKNLAMALAGEAGELVEIYQWVSERDSRSALSNPEIVASTKDELADIVIYAVRLADVMSIDLERAIGEKIESNALRYSVASAKGNARKQP